MRSNPALWQQVLTTYQTTFCEMPRPHTFPSLATGPLRLELRQRRPWGTPSRFLCHRTTSALLLELDTESQEHAVHIRFEDEASVSVINTQTTIAKKHRIL
jgi:hypothetical protein